jgi:predicted aldo/keto reductase-like oxidoreductase
MKTLGGGKGKIVQDGVATAEECLRFALSQDVCTVVSGMDSMDVLKKNIATARNFQPMEGDELQRLLAKVKPHAGDGRHERFKSTIDFEGVYHRKQHAFE